MNDYDMSGDFKKLLTLLKKILQNHSGASEQVSKFLEQKKEGQPLNLNLCFFTFVPMSPEELMEFEELYDDYVNDTEESSVHGSEIKMEFKLNTTDLDFLKKHGIRFN